MEIDKPRWPKMYFPTGAFGSLAGFKAGGAAAGNSRAAEVRHRVVDRQIGRALPISGCAFNKLKDGRYAFTTRMFGRY